MKKRLLTAALAVILTLSLAACGNGNNGDVDKSTSGNKDNISSDENGNTNLPTPGNSDNASSLSTDFQKNMSQTDAFEIPYLCETEGGYYFQYNMFVYYIDKQTKATTILCAKPDCLHEDATCNAYVNGWSLSYSNDKLYYYNGDRVLENGKYTDYGWRLYSMEIDGTNHSVSQSLEFTPSGDTTLYKTTPIIHRSNVYFSYKGVVYTVPLGEKIDKATAIWGKETTGSSGAAVIVDTNALRYTLWADGDYMYFMANVQQSNGTYKDTLFAYHTEEKEVKQIWQTPDASEVGEWEATGVSVSQWYVKDGYIYFYLSGGDMWRTSLETGKHEKLAQTSEKTRYGTAVFSDKYMCLMNTAPGNAMDLFGNGFAHTGGDTLFVYGLDGSFVKEISLNALYQNNSGIEHCQPIFCSGNDIYFLVDAKTWNDPVNGVSTANINLVLCCANIETGDITQVYGWN